MFLAVHASVGALAGNAVSDPFTAFVLGFISHFLTDMIPHGDENMYEGYKSGAKKRLALMYVAADAFATIVLITIFFLKQDYFSTVSVAMGIVGGLLPDLLVGLYEIFHPKFLRQFHKFHMRNHHFLIKRLRKFERDIPLACGLALQAFVLVVLIRMII